MFYGLLILLHININSLSIKYCVSIFEWKLCIQFCIGQNSITNSNSTELSCIQLLLSLSYTEIYKIVLRQFAQFV